jgi:hypothetical protein
VTLNIERRRIKDKLERKQEEGECCSLMYYFNIRRGTEKNKKNSNFIIVFLDETEALRVE